MKVSCRCAKQKPSYAGKHGIANISILPGHSVGCYAAEEAITHDQIGASSKFLDERIEVAEVVAVIRISHYTIHTLRGGNRTRKRCSIAANWHMDHASSATASDLLRSIGGAIVADNYFPRDARPLKKDSCFHYTFFKRLRLVETGHDDTKFYRHRHLQIGRSLRHAALAMPAIIVRASRHCDRAT